MTAVVRGLVVAVLAVASAMALSCNVNQYCLNCETGDAGPKDGNGGSGDAHDATSGDAGDGGICVPSIEICDGKDNDCDGIVDEGPLTDVGIGSACPNVKGDCAGGKLACISGAIKCDKLGSPELCDNRDNDCDGVIDNGDPGDGVTQGGSKCGTDVGECVAGTNHCIAGAVQCIGRVDSQGSESCNGKDDDCDGQFDEGLSNLGACGSNAVGICKLGTLACEAGGVVRCQNAVLPGIETCNNLDDDCDGTTDEGFDLTSDPQNCGACGNVCQFAHAFPGCAIPPGMTAPACNIDQCQAGFHDNNHDPADGCEFGPCSITGAEVCNGRDDDCSGSADDNLGAPPAICATKGACAGTTATCDGSDGFNCHYGPTVSTGSDGSLVPETACDGIDNDCDGKVDEGQPNLGQTCHDAGIGACQGTGHFGCDAANPNGPAICIIDVPGKAVAVESCDNIDNDCDGLVDEGAGSGNLVGQSWVNIGNHEQMMEFEASRPDAGSDSVGQIQTTVCSKADALPWTNIKYPDAVAACATVGASLCTEQDWHRTCSVVLPTTYPIVLPSTGVINQVVEAEDYFALSVGTDATNGTHSWTEDYNIDTTGRSFSGISDMQAGPDTGTSYQLQNTDVRLVSPRLDYQFNVTKAGTYTAWLLLDAPNGNGNRAAVGFDNVRPPDNSSRVVTTSDNVWQWVKATPAAPFALTVGVHTLNVYMARDGIRLDAVALTDGSAPALPANPAGNTWAYASSPNTAQVGTCNDHNFSAADDDTIPTGDAPSCHTTPATGQGPFDLSGNVKEWVIAHQPGQNPIRGGAASSNDNGTTCALNFTLADDKFFFPNVGFRCCRVGP